MKLKTLLLSAGALALSAATAQADYRLTILHTNDLHSRIEPISRFNSGCGEGDNEAGKCFGGSARLVTAVAEARAQFTNSILVDGGDQFQGSLFYTYYKGKVAAEFMNKMGYDAMTVGNHEFDDGPEVLRGFADTINFPILLGNADISAEPMLADKITKSTILEIGGEKIGLIGLSPEDTQDLASPGKNVMFSDPIAAVAAESGRLEAQGVNKIIVLSHSGYVVDLAVAEAVPWIDVIVGGHSHSFLSNTSDRASGPYPTMVGNVAVVQAASYGKYLGELNLVFDDDGNIVTATGEPRIMDASVSEDADSTMRVSELAAPLDEIRNKVVANAAEAIDGERGNCRQMECQMGNLIADAMLERVKDQGVQIAFMNSGGIRASVDAGEVTMGEVMTVLPFQNTLSTFQITGAMMIEALENGASRHEEGSGRFPQVAGLKYTFDLSKDPGSRISDVMVQDGDAFVPIDAEKVYGVVSNDFIRNGGDGYILFREAMNVYDFGPDLAEVVAEYLADSGAYKPYLDGRITMK